MGMDQHGNRLGHLLQQTIQGPQVIHVAVAEHDRLDFFQIQSQLFYVVRHAKGAIPRIEQDRVPLAAFTDGHQQRKAMLADEGISENLAAPGMARPVDHLRIAEESYPHNCP